MKSAPGALPGSAPGKSRSGGVNFLNVLDIIIILAYFVGMIVLGLIANKKQTGVDDYYLGGRSMGALDGRLDRRFVRHRYILKQLFHGHHRRLVCG